MTTETKQVFSQTNRFTKPIDCLWQRSMSQTFSQAAIDVAQVVQKRLFVRIRNCFWMKYCPSSKTCHVRRKLTPCLCLWRPYNFLALAPYGEIASKMIRACPPASTRVPPESGTKACQWKEIGRNSKKPENEASLTCNLAFDCPSLSCPAILLIVLARSCEKDQAI